MSVRRFAAYSCGLVVLSLPSSRAFAQEPAIAPPPPVVAQPPAQVVAAPRQFGDASVFALSLNHNLLVNQADVFAGEEIQASFFLVQGLSVALAVGAQWLSSSPVSTATASHSTFVLHVGPRVGYDLRFSSLVSLWPQAGVDYRQIDSTATSTTAGAGGATSTSSQSGTASAFGVSVLAPVLIHPSRGFFVGAGPSFYADFSNSTKIGSTSNDNAKITSVGAIATIGGDF